MSAAEVSDPGPGGPESNITLLPLALDGAAALAPEPDLGIVRVLLVRSRWAWPNAFNESVLRSADDLFACAAHGGAYYDPLPKGADVLSITLEFYFDHSPQPRRVDLAPPHTILFQHLADAPTIRAFLARKRFIPNAQTGLQSVE